MEETLKKLKKKHLESGKEKYEKMIKEWSHVWEYDFELDNYTPEELQKAINEVCETNFSLEEIKNIYKHPQNREKKGLKSLGDIVEANKIPINKKAFKNLVKYYKETQDESIFDKDIFKVLDKIIKMAIFNPPSINTKHSMSNVSELGVYIMNGKDIYKRDKYEL